MRAFKVEENEQESDVGVSKKQKKKKAENLKIITEDSDEEKSSKKNESDEETELLSQAENTQESTLFSTNVRTGIQDLLSNNAEPQSFVSRQSFVFESKYHVRF